MPVGQKVKLRSCSTCRYTEFCAGIFGEYLEIHGTNGIGCSAAYKREFGLLQLLSDCNQKCLFCVRRKQRHLHLDIVDKEGLYGLPTGQAKLELLGITGEVLITGGEPTLRSDLPEIIGFAKTRNIGVGINTNAVRLSDNTYCRKLKKAGLEHAIISLHSHIRKTSERISQVPGNYDKTMAGIRNCIANSIGVRLVHVICSHNFRHMRNYCEFAAKLQINGINFVFIKPTGIHAEDGAGLVPSLRSIGPHLKEALGFCTLNNISFSVADVPLCYMPYHENNNLHSNEILHKYPAEPDAVKKWNLDRQTNLEDEEYGYKGNGCKNCPKTNHCTGVIREYAQIYGVDELGWQK